MLDPNNKRKFRNWYCTHFHKITNKEHLGKVLDELKKNEKDIWIGTFMEVAQYGQERDTAKLSITSVKPGEIRFEIRDKMNDKLFDYPLSVKIRVNPDWKKVKALQNEKEIKAEIIEHNNAKFALIQALPDKGTVTLIKL